MNPANSASLLAIVLIALALPIADGKPDDPPAAPEAPPPSPTVSIDQESAAGAFDRGASTLDFLRYIQKEKIAIGDLVVSSRALAGDMNRPSENEKKARVVEIKEAAGKAGVKAIRLTVVLGRDEPSVAVVDPVLRKKAVDVHLEHVRRATELGATQVSFPINSSGFYDDQRDAAKEGIVDLWDRMNKAKLECDLLITNGLGLPSNANYLREVIQGVYEKQPSCRGHVGVLLELGRLDYNPKNAFLELTRPIATLDSIDPTKGATQKPISGITADVPKDEKGKPKEDPKGAPDPRDAGKQAAKVPDSQGGTDPKKVQGREAARPTTPKNDVAPTGSGLNTAEAGPANTDKLPTAGKPEDQTVPKPAKVPGAENVAKALVPVAASTCIVKAIVFETRDKKSVPGGAFVVDVPGLQFLDREILDSADFRGDLSIRYRGDAPLPQGIAASRAEMEARFNLKKKE